MTSNPVNHYKDVPNVFSALENVHGAIDEHGLHFSAQILGQLSVAINKPQHVEE